jgi:hypothetical protein
MELNARVCSSLYVSRGPSRSIRVKGLTLTKPKIDLGNKEYAAGLSFVAVSRVRSLSDICFTGFTSKDFNALRTVEGYKKESLKKSDCFL